MPGGYLYSLRWPLTDRVWRRTCERGLSENLIHSRFPAVGMARRGRGIAKIPPMELDLWFDFETTTGVYYIDLAQCLSLVNRKMIRQGQQFAIESMEMFSDGTNVAYVYRMPNTWPLVNAWVKARDLWMESQDQVLDLEPSIASPYRDFKVYADSVHAAEEQSAGNLLPLGYAASGVNAVYNWDYSTVQIPNNTAPGQTDEFTLHVLGDDTGVVSGDSKGLIHGYAMARSRPASEEPNTPAARGWMNQLFDLGDNDSEIRVDIINNNDSPPYLLAEENTIQEYYPGGAAQPSYPQMTIETVMTNRSTAATGGSVSSTKAPGFVANLGLLAIGVEVDPEVNTPTIIRFKVSLAAGPSKGLMARPMEEVN